MPSPVIRPTREQLAHSFLPQYGEVDLAERVLTITDADLARIHRSGGSMRSKPAVGCGDGLLIGRAATLAGSCAREAGVASRSGAFARMDDRALPDELPANVCG